MTENPDFDIISSKHKITIFQYFTKMEITQVQQDKYTMDPGQSSLSPHIEKFFWSKMIFEQKQIRKMNKSYIIND